MRAVLMLIAFSLPVGAAAQSAGARVGLPIESLTFEDAQRVDVDASDPHGWVRITFAGERTVRLDVAVSNGAREARAALQNVVRTTSGELPPVQFADVAFGDDGLIAFVRDNIAVVVRSGSARRDARIVDAAIRAAPLGVPDLSPISVLLPQLDEGVPAAIPLGPDVLAAHVVAHGPAIARKTRRGWVVIRTSPGAIRVETRAADTLLRRR